VPVLLLSSLTQKGAEVTLRGLELAPSTSSTSPPSAA